MAAVFESFSSSSVRQEEIFPLNGVFQRIFGQTAKKRREEDEDGYGLSAPLAEDKEI